MAAALAATLVLDTFLGLGIVAVMPKEPGRVFIDFFMLWSSAKFVLAHGAAGLWGDALHAFQEALLGGWWGWHPFPYPPLFIFAVLPLGLLPYLAAYAVAMAASAAGFVIGAAGRRPGLPLGLVLLTSPAALLNALFGHNGFLTAALLAGGARLLGERPLIAGALLGALVYKPQLALVVPVALVAAGAWRALAGAAASAGALVLASAAVFGIDAWREWIAFLPGFSAGVVGFADEFFPKMASLAPALYRAGLPIGAALAVQSVLAAGTLLLVWIVFRRNPHRREAAALLLLAPFLTTPYAYAYDLPAAAVAIVWLVLAKLRDGASLAERIALTLGWLVPLVAIFPPPPLFAPAVPLVLIGVTLVAARAALSKPGTSRSPHPPHAQVYRM